MSETVAVTLPDDMMAQVEAVSTQDGVPQSEVIRTAVREYLFLRRFRELRGQMIQDLANRGISLTDEDVFEMVS